MAGKEHLYDLEAEMGISGQILYCLYEVSSGARCIEWGFNQILYCCSGKLCTACTR